MNCQRCGYDFEPSRGLECPRCGASLDCPAVSCGECGGCTLSIDGLRGLLSGGDADAE
jgi:predicted amidophosphoribosyltransferase